MCDTFHKTRNSTTYLLRCKYFVN